MGVAAAGEAAPVALGIEVPGLVRGSATGYTGFFTTKAARSAKTERSLIRAVEYRQETCDAAWPRPATWHFFERDYHTPTIINPSASARKAAELREGLHDLALVGTARPCTVHLGHHSRYTVSVVQPGILPCLPRQTPPPCRAASNVWPSTPPGPKRSSGGPGAPRPGQPCTVAREVSGGRKSGGHSSPPARSIDR